MRRNILLFKFVLIITILSATGCGAEPPLSPSPGPDIAPTAMPSASTTLSTEESIVVAFVKDGNIQLWDSTTNQSETFVRSGDVVSVWISDDGQAIAFTRRQWVGDILDGYEQLSLWAINRDGGNPRQLVPAADLRQRLSPSERESTNFFQVGWVPQTHQLIFSGTKYIFQAEGLSHAIPLGVYLVNADAGAITVLAEAPEDLRFMPSPDGQQIALLSPDSLSFINADGSNRRSDVLTYPQIGRPGPLFPTGVWTGDSSAFVITGSLEYDPAYNINFTFWRVPANGSSPETLATVTKSDPSSVTFSPDGRHASYLQVTDSRPPEVAGWSIMPFNVEAGPLAIPYYGKEAFMANLHWSPAGNAYVIDGLDLFQLCPDAKEDSQRCGQPVHLKNEGIITSIQWVDGERFFVAGIEPNTLSLGRLDGTITPIVTWADNESISWNMSTATGR